MPFLRFARDKRGYETTSLVHAVRRSGRSQQQILYWFRTPPGVRVGRPALDEDAIRWIEEHNPDIDFDWPKILEAKAPAAPAPEDNRMRRGRRDKPERGRGASQPPSRPKRAEPEPLVPERVDAEAVEEDGQAGAGEIETSADDAAAVEDELAVAIEELTHPDVERVEQVAAMPVEQSFGPEQLVRLRARYAELLARIAERGGDAANIEALRTQAEPLNPDGWVTEEEVRKGIEGFEPRIRDLRAALGLRRRRRSRRGGRRRAKREEG